MKTILTLSLLLSSYAFAEFKSGEEVPAVGGLIRDRRTGEMLALVQNYTEDKGVKTYLDNYGYYIVSRDAAAAPGMYKVLYFLNDGFTGEEINVIAEQAGETVYAKYNRKYKKAMKHLGKDAWQKFKLDNWENHSLLGKVWRWPVALIGFGAGTIADGVACNGKFVYSYSAHTVADIKEAKIEKGMTRVGLAEFKNNVIKVNHRVFKTIVEQF